MQTHSERLAWQRQNYEKKREYFAKAARKHKLKWYGLTEEVYNDMLSRQGGVCAICQTNTPGGNGIKWDIDHCHTSGKVRGLLCNHCNNALGRVKDDVKILLKMITYLEGNYDDAPTVRNRVQPQ